jgi:hypothetical protein
MNDFGGGMKAFERLDHAAIVLGAVLIVGLIIAGAVTVAMWVRERWRTRKDKGYNANKWGAF